MQKLLFTTLLTLNFAYCTKAQDAAPPPFQVADLSGNHYNLNKLQGKVVVLNFWFIQCKPCIQEMPELNKLVKKYADQEVVFLALATNSVPDLKAFLKKRDFDYHIIPDSRAVAEAYGVEGYPTHVVINPKGAVAYRTMGLSPFTVGEVESSIEKALDEKE